MRYRVIAFLLVTFAVASVHVAEAQQPTKIPRIVRGRYRLSSGFCMTFADLGLSDQLLRAVEESGYSDPTPIQRGAIPSVPLPGTGRTTSCAWLRVPSGRETSSSVAPCTTWLLVSR